MDGEMNFLQSYLSRGRGEVVVREITFGRKLFLFECKSQSGMDEESNVSEVNKRNDERRLSKTEEPEMSTDTRSEIKKFKENLLQSISDGASIISGGSADYLPLETPRSRERSASRARDAIFVTQDVINELDENKIYELKEAFLLFDLDGDGCISHRDLKGTLISLGEKVEDHAVAMMLAEAQNPLDFNAFVNLLGYRTLELDTEDTLVTALSRWDKNNSGFISEEKIRHDLMAFGDRFSEKEADYALDGAPSMQKNGRTMIDYIKFCSLLCGLKKSEKK